MTDLPHIEREPSGPHPTGEYALATLGGRDTRIPPWFATTIAVAVATAALIGWGEVRFVRRAEYDLNERSRDKETHLLEERITKHEDNAATEAKEARDVRELVIKMNSRIDEIARAVGVDEAPAARKRWRARGDQ